MRTESHPLDALGSHVRPPQHPGEFLHPLAFHFIKTLAQDVEDSVAADLCLAVNLWI